MECERCGADKLKLFDVVLDSGIRKVCNDCIRKENLPVVKPISDKDLEEVNKKQSVYSRLAKISGFVFRKKDDFAIEEDEELKKLAEANYATDAEIADKNELVENFHWIVMRFRRRKKLTQEQFACEMNVPSVVIKNLEKGLVPKNHISLIKNIENFLGVRLFKEQKTFEEEREKLKSDFEKGDVEFDKLTTKTLTISDLKDMKRKKEGLILGNGEESSGVFREEINLNNGGTYTEIESKKEVEENKISEKEFPKESKKDLSQDEMDKIIFGK